jgi:hypothetical protein
MKHTSASNTTMVSLHPELIKLVFEYLLEWREGVQTLTIDWDKTAYRLFTVSRVSRQWCLIMRETLREEYLNANCHKRDDIVELYHCVDWLMRQVASLVTRLDIYQYSGIRDDTLALLTQCRWMQTYYPPHGISNQGIEHLTNLIRLTIAFRTENITWSLVEKLTNLTSLDVLFRGKRPLTLHVFPSMTTLTKLAINTSESMDLSQLNQLTNLTTLKISRSPLTLYSFQSLTHLTHLVLKCASIGPMVFNHMTQLRHLELHNCEMDQCGLSLLTNLRILLIRQTKLPTYSLLLELTSLQCLVLTEVYSYGLADALSYLTSLTLLDICECHSILPSHLSPLVNLSYLTHTHCKGLKTYSHHLPSPTWEERRDIFRSIRNPLIV